MRNVIRDISSALSHGVSLSLSSTKGKLRSAVAENISMTNKKTLRLKEKDREKKERNLNS